MRPPVEIFQRHPKFEWLRKYGIFIVHFFPCFFERACQASCHTRQITPPSRTYTISYLAILVYGLSVCPFLTSTDTRSCQPSTMVGLKRSSKGSKFSMKTTAVSVPSEDPPLGFKSPPTLIDEKTIYPSVIALRAKNYTAAYADPLMRQKWNMYEPFGIQQFLSLNDYVSHRAQETADGSNLRLARYYWYHLENQASVATCLIHIMGACATLYRANH